MSRMKVHYDIPDTLKVDRSILPDESHIRVLMLNSPTNNLDALIQDSLKRQAISRWQKIIEQREEILEAFIAKYGCEPDECFQRVTQMPNGDVEFSVRRAE